MLRVVCSLSAAAAAAAGGQPTGSGHYVPRMTRWNRVVDDLISPVMSPPLLRCVRQH